MRNIKRRHISPAERARILARSNGCCAECGNPGHGDIYINGRLYLPATKFEFDHVIPLAAGGADVEGNMQALDIKCHKAKTVCDMGVIAKGRRMFEKLNPAAPKKIRKWKRKLQSRGFRKDVRRRFDGVVELRAEMERRRAQDKKFYKGKQW